MWILTNFGAFMPAMRPADTIAEGDPQTMQIRARRRVDLNRLRRFYLPELGKTYVVPGADYQYRANVSHSQLAAAMVKITFDIDYVSFKDTTVTKWGDHQLHRTYMRVWGAIAEGLGPRRRARRQVAPAAYDVWEGWKP